MSDTEDLSGTVWRAPNGLAAWEVELLTGEQKDPSPSDVRDGDLLTGTLYGLPFEDIVCRRFDTGNVWIVGFPAGLCVGGMGDGWDWARHFTVSSRKPAPTPLLPWIEHPGWYRRSGEPPSRLVWHSRATVKGPETHPQNFERVGVIPWDLIESLRENYNRGHIDKSARLILDAADAS